jgi:hypothetical protein
MAQEYQPRRFFRNAPNRLLERYFAKHKALSEVGFGALTETQVEPIYEAWLPCAPMTTPCVDASASAGLIATACRRSRTITGRSSVIFDSTQAAGRMYTASSRRRNREPEHSP